MKKLLLITILILGLSTISVYAQEEQSPPDEGISREEDEQIIDEEVEIQIQEDGSSEEAEDSITLSDELQVTPQSNISFLTILFAILTPALLIVVAYLLIKMSSK